MKPQKITITALQNETVIDYTWNTITPADIVKRIFTYFLVLSCVFGVIVYKSGMSNMRLQLIIQLGIIVLVFSCGTVFFERVYELVNKTTIHIKPKTIEIKSKPLHPAFTYEVDIDIESIDSIYIKRSDTLPRHFRPAFNNSQGLFFRYKAGWEEQVAEFMTEETAKVIEAEVRNRVYKIQAQRGWAKINSSI